MKIPNLMNTRLPRFMNIQLKLTNRKKQLNYRIPVLIITHSKNKSNNFKYTNMNKLKLLSVIIISIIK